MASKIVAEYAKSARSSCKKCGATISKDCLRLGIVSKGPGNFDVTKWHHIDCFPSESHEVIGEKISGFSLLKHIDQEALRKVAHNRKAFNSLDAEEKDKGSSKKLKTYGIYKEVAGSSVDKMQGEGDGNVEENKDSELEIKFSVNEIKEKYKDANLIPNWKAFQTVIFLEQEDGFHTSSKIAAFDFDGCLVKTSVKRVGPDAWSLLYPSIPAKLQSLYNNGYKLVIFTNESNIDRWKNSRQKAVDSKIGRLINFIKLVKIPIQVFISCGMEGTGDPFRKPRTGMWRLLQKNFNSGLEIDMDQNPVFRQIDISKLYGPY
ncbi:hypothetical protein AMTR_s00075p00081460 [Amborella trichopoda]|uniref:PARP-type domain-containing protein n=1 Tax=Amborella trichopoda TaxID=13333 RepID=W1P9H5_AMBTC|nr:hypothetical protein AMTR_s00075p00081460 [Amborella trichopoda]